MEELVDKKSLDQIISDVKELIRRTSIDSLNSVQWEFNQRYLFGNDSEKPLIKAGKLYSKEGPVAKGAIWTSLDTGKLFMNTSTGWKHIASLNTLNKPDLINIFNPRKDYHLEDPVVRTNVSNDNWIAYNFKKYEKYALTKTQCPFTGKLARLNNNRSDIAQDISSIFSSGAGTYEFICMVDDAKYFYFTTGSSSNVLSSMTLTDLGSALEPVKLTNITDETTYITFPIEKGKTYYYTKSACSFAIFYGTGTGTKFVPGKQVNNSGDSGAGSWSFKADGDGNSIRLYIGKNAHLDKFELRCEDIPDYTYSYPYVVSSDTEVLPAEPRLGDMIFHPFAQPTGTTLTNKGIPLWWNGTAWVTSTGGTWTT